MELHQNGKKVCDIVGITKSPDKKYVLQLGQLSPVDDIDLFSVFVSEEVVFGLCDKFEIVEKEFRVPISIWCVNRLSQIYELKIQVIKQAA